MANSDDLYASKTTYVLDAENAAEMARLINQSQLLTRAMGGLFPSNIDLSTVHNVLDIACGPGGWAIDVATTHPTMQVQGIDISEMMIHYASIVAEEQDMSNAHFRQMNVLGPLDFPDNSFDFVNARLIGPFMTVAAWPQLIKECYRILRPGGSIRFTECEMPVTNSLAFEQLNVMVNYAPFLSKQTFSPVGRHFGIFMMMGHLLRNAGFLSIAHNPHAIDFSAGTDAHFPMYQDWMVMFKLIQPFWIKMGVTTQDEVDILYAQMIEQMKTEDFCGIWCFLSVLGQKPL